MIVGARVAKTFQHQHRGALAPAGAIGARGERLAPPIEGKSTLAGELGERRRGGHDRHPTGQGQTGFVVAQ